MLDKVFFGTTTLLDLLIALIIILFFLVLTRILVLYLRRRFKKKMSRDNMEILVKITYYSLIVVMLFSVLPFFGIRVSSLLVAGGVFTIIIGFASQKIVSSMISGIFLIFERPVKIGDWVKIEGEEGYIEDIKVLQMLRQKVRLLFLFLLLKLCILKHHISCFHINAHQLTFCKH